MFERVLLLNGDYTPLTQVTIYRAVNMILADKVVPVEGTAKRLRTPNTIFEVPSVMALTRYINVPQRNKKWSRRGVFERDNYTCIFCGASMRTDKLRRQDFTLEHIIPVSQGGKSNWVNTACACYGCNHQKADRTPHQAGMKLLWEPKTPRTNYWKFSGNFPVEWAKYIRD